MNLPALTLSNWRSHADTTLRLARLTILRGANHVGKSSVADALSYLFTGQCNGTDARGAGAVKLIREGERKAMIGVAISNGLLAQPFEACCYVTAQGRKVDFPDEVFSADWFATRQPALACLTNTQHFIGMSAADQKSLLSALVLPDDYAFEPWVQEHLDATKLKSKDGKRTVSLAGPLNDVIADVYEAAFAERTVVNRTIKAFVIPSGDTTAAKDRKDTKAKLDALREDLSGLQAKQMSAGAERRAYDQRVSTEDKAVAEAAARVSREEQELPGIQARLLKPTALKQAQSDAGNAAKKNELTRKLAVADAKAAERRSLRDRLMKMSEGKCPTCTLALTADNLADVVGVVVAEYDAASAEAKDLSAQAAALGDPEGAQRKLEAHEQAQKDAKRAEERIGQAREASAAAQKAVQARPVAPAAGEDHSGAVATLQDRIGSGEKVLAVIDAANALILRQQDARKQLKELELTSANLERLVDEFGPKGLKARLLDENIGAFQQAMNDVLSGWGYTAELQFEPFSFGVHIPDVGQRPLKVLSKSEQYRFAIAFQVALAMWSGIKFVVIDEADMLDAAGRKALFGMLLKSGLEQAIVLATDERAEAPKIAGVVTYRFTRGEDGATKAAVL